MRDPGVIYETSGTQHIDYLEWWYPDGGVEVIRGSTSVPCRCRHCCAAHNRRRMGPKRRSNIECVICALIQDVRGSHNKRHTIHIEQEAATHVNRSWIDRIVAINRPLRRPKVPFSSQGVPICQRRSKTGPPLIVSAEVKVDHPPGLVCAALTRRA